MGCGGSFCDERLAPIQDIQGGGELRSLLVDDDDDERSLFLSRLTKIAVNRRIVGRERQSVVYFKSRLLP